MPTRSRRPLPTGGLRQQIVDAFRASGLTLADLILRSGLQCSEATMSRKMGGTQTLRAEEVEALARALCVQVVTGPKRGAVA